MKTFLLLAMAIVFVALGLWSIEERIRLFEVNKASMQYRLGTKVLVSPDTLWIIDCNYYLKTYTLSNGTLIDKNDAIFIIKD